MPIPAAQAQIVWHPPTQDEVAQRFAGAQAGRVRYCHDARAWLLWDGVVWRRDRTGAVVAMIRAIARPMAVSPSGRCHAPAGGARFLAGVERFARADPALAVTGETWDRDPLRLGTPAGSVDLATGRLLPPDPRDGISLTTAVAPADQADCPLWRRFLAETFGGDTELIAFLQRYCGYALTGSAAEQLLLFGWGSGGNGKSLFLDTLLAVMGDYARVAPSAILDVEQNGLGSERLRGARLIAVAESEGCGWTGRHLKRLTGGDPVVGPHGTLLAVGKLLVMGNAPPRLRVVDDAIRRRLRIVPFHHCPAVVDRGLAAALRVEAPAILRWMIEGCLAWQAEGLGRAAAITEATTDYFADEDGIGRFLGACCHRDPDDRTLTVSSAALFAAWRAWAARAGEAVGSTRDFGRALTVRGIRRERSTWERGYVGLGLREGHDA